MFNRWELYQKYSSGIQTKSIAVRFVCLYNIRNTASNMAARRSCAQVAQLVKLAQIAPASRADVGGCIQKCMQRVQQLQASDLRDLTDGLATLRWRDENTWKVIGSVVTQKVKEIKVAQLVRVAAAFSVASQRSPEMLSAIVGRVKESPDKLSTWSWGDLLLSLERANMRQDPQLLKVVANVWLADFDALKKLKTYHITGFADASLRSDFYHQAVFYPLAAVLVERMDRLSPFELSRVVLAWGRAACKDDDLLKSLCKAMRGKLPSYPKNRISHAIHGLSLLDCKDKQLLLDLASTWATAGPSRPVEVVHVISSLEKSGVLDSSLCNEIAACSLHCVPQFEAWSLATILHVCLRSGCTHVEFLESLGRAVSGKISEFSTPDLCAAAFAGAKLSLAPILGSCVPAAAAKRVSEFNGSQLTLMMHAVSRLLSNPGEHFPVLERAALQHVATLNALDLRYLATALAKAGVSHQTLMDAIAERAVQVVDSLDPSTINHIVWAHCELKVINVDLFKALSRRSAETVSSFKTSELGCTALAFVGAGTHEEMPLISFAREAVRRLGNMHPMCCSLLARAFIQADLESPEVTALLEGLAAVAFQNGWTGLNARLEIEWTDFQKQSAETVQEFLPSILLNQRHQMGPVLTMALQQPDGTVLNLEVDPMDLELSNLDRVVRERRDDFLENLGVEVLRLKVKDQDDLRYHLLQIFGSPVAPPCLADKPEESQASDLAGPLEESNSPLCENLWIENESGSLQHENLL